MKKGKKEEQKNIAEYHQRKRRKHKIKLFLLSMLMFVIALILVVIYNSFNKAHYINYTEDAKIKYRVNLEENDFYKENYIEEGTNVVASLIKDIDTNFLYNLKLDEEQECTYQYKILANIEVKEKSQINPIYELEEELISKESKTLKTNNIEIIENITINYDEYNDKIKQFISFYELDNITSKLTLNMYIEVINEYNGQQVNKDKNVLALEIPLTTKTVNISMDSKAVENAGELLIQKGKYTNIEFLIITAIIIGVTGLIIFIKLIKYIMDTKSAEKMYEQEIKRILFDYKNYIQKVTTELDTSNYKVLYVKSFDEILLTRITVQSSIIMYQENEQKTKFMIRDGEILFVYILGVQEIRNDLIEKSKKNKKGEETGGNSQKNRKN